MVGGAYEQAGVAYSDLDPAKVLAQTAAATTAGNAFYLGVCELTASRGESAFVWYDRNAGGYAAQVTEGLGTKALVADACRSDGKTYYDSIAKDTVAMAANDLITVGAMPAVTTAYWSVESGDWFKDRERAADLINGWQAACEEAGAVWGGGETPALKDMHTPNTIELACSMMGYFMRKRHVTLQENLIGNEDIILLEGSGIHANGITLARRVAALLTRGYDTELPSGRRYGEALLTPTPIYVAAVRELLKSDVKIDYMANITGHGLRKLMRADAPYTYRIHTLPKPQEEFNLIQDTQGCSDEEMYGTFNMGAGFAVMVHPSDTDAALEILHTNDYPALHAGTVETGKKQVILEPNGVTFAGDTLNIR